MSKKTDIATIISNQQLAPGIFSMWLRTEIAKDAPAGQFINVYTRDNAKLLPRPISICEIDHTGRIRIVFRVVGKGTDEISTYADGETLKITGPLGNGYQSAMDVQIEKSKEDVLYPFDTNQLQIDEDKEVLIMGGGIGIPPMLGLAKELKCKKKIVVGYRSDQELFLTRELNENGEVFIATDDGSFGTHGTVIDCVKENGIAADMIFACGPKPMLRGIKELGEQLNVPTFISMEERMACGVGACLACVCKSTDVDEHSKVNNKRVCVEGPVFIAGEVDLA